MEGPARFFPIVIGFFIASYYMTFSEESRAVIDTINRTLITILIFWVIHQIIEPISYILSGLDKQQFYAPGSLLNTQVNTKHTLTRGVRSNEAIWFESGPAFERNSLVSGDKTHNVMVYYAENILASGWLLGEEYLLNRSAVRDVPMGDGRLVLFGMRPQYRGQPNATFSQIHKLKLLQPPPDHPH